MNSLSVQDAFPEQDWTSETWDVPAQGPTGFDPTGGDPRLEALRELANTRPDRLPPDWLEWYLAQRVADSLQAQRAEEAEQIKHEDALFAAEKIKLGELAATQQWNIRHYGHPDLRGAVPETAFESGATQPELPCLGEANIRAGMIRTASGKYQAVVEFPAGTDWDRPLRMFIDQTSPEALIAAVRRQLADNPGSRLLTPEEHR